MTSRTRSAAVRPVTGLRGPAVAAGLGAVVLLAGGCSIDLSHLRPGAGDDAEDNQEEFQDAAPVLAAALDELATWPAVQVDGRAAQGEDAPWEAGLVLADTGTLHGTLDGEDTQVEVMEADEHLFLSAETPFWLSENAYAVDADAYPDSWVQVDREFLGANLADVFHPAHLAEELRERGPDEGSAEAVEDPDAVEGTDAYRIPVDGGDVWVSQEEPHQLLRLQIADLAVPDTAADDDSAGGEAQPDDDDEAGQDPPDSEDNGTEEDAGEQAPAGDPWRADVTVEQPSTDTVEEMYDTLLTESEELTGARDNRSDIGWTDSDLGMDCSVGGACTVTGEVENQGSDQGVESAVRARMDVTVSNPDLGDETCNDSQGVEPGESVELSCGVDFALEPASAPESYEVEADAELSTRAMTGNAVDDLVELLEEQRETILDQLGNGGADEDDDTATDAAENDSDEDADDENDTDDEDTGGDDDT
ncbi:hypothetical protein RIF23_10015 [Lipingzhangella sp. LS1_29]|uniref:Uncharacterized protein n=1 Tax=Lipingzhangella rawalii TaxID=2055835 RepID=A0ABU2H5S1_9ACTN|nr:hypothetical protein [Lipingzhangella rawalii]MDS1270633.1 hypothetical protein [Lipingzhangella rawalii]